MIQPQKFCLATKKIRGGNCINHEVMQMERKILLWSVALHYNYLQKGLPSYLDNFAESGTKKCQLFVTVNIFVIMFEQSFQDFLFSSAFTETLRHFVHLFCNQIKCRKEFQIFHKGCGYDNNLISIFIRYAMTKHALILVIQQLLSYDY